MDRALAAGRRAARRLALTPLVAGLGWRAGARATAVAGVWVLGLLALWHSLSEWTQYLDRSGAWSTVPSYEQAESEVELFGHFDDDVEVRIDPDEIFNIIDLADGAVPSKVLTPMYRPNEEIRKVLLHHIPKTSGASLRADIAQQLNFTVPDHEDCFVSYFQPNKINVVIFREPRRHVLSQYMHGKYNSHNRKRHTKRAGFPLDSFDHEGDVRGIRTWLGHFKPDVWRVGDGFFENYHPTNFQSRVMTCNYPLTARSNHGVHSARDLTPSLEEAKRSALSAHWIGITELYTPSFCMLEYMLRHRLSRQCLCYHRRKGHKGRKTHGVPAYSLGSFPPDVIESIDDITRTDRRLYEWAKALVVERIRYVERKTNLTLLCEADLAAIAASPHAHLL